LRRGVIYAGGVLELAPSSPVMKQHGEPLPQPKWSSDSACMVILYLELRFGSYAIVQSTPCHIGQSGLPEAHGNVVNHRSEEPWVAFINRASSETVTYLRSFKSSEIVERGDVHFNVTRVTGARDSATNCCKIPFTLICLRLRGFE
jgi:hypothetical protein